jgi:hypothetical protein
MCIESDGVDDAFTARHQQARICCRQTLESPARKTASFLVELTGLEPVTPTLPGAGRNRDQARKQGLRVVVAVVKGVVVVKIVVN